MQIQFAKVIECADPGTDELLITGVAVRYDSIGHPSDGVPTIIRAGALQGLDSVTLDMYHNRGRLIARSPRTMQFIDGPKELRLKANPVRTREAEDAVELIRGGVITGLSIDARVTKHVMKGNIRVIEQAELASVALVDRPGFSDTHVTAVGPDIRPLTSLVPWCL